MGTVEHNEVASEGALRDPRFIEDLHLQMLKFATLQLSDPHLAEDAVQEALVGALKNASSFRSTAALKSWVFAILKNKIVDTFRQRKRLVYAGSLFSADEEADESGAPSLFDLRGQWQAQERPREWSDPEASFRDGEFWLVFNTCLEGLPPRQARVLMMREYIGLNSEEICTTVEISMKNLHVMLHRARLRLRRCLENHWFAERSAPC